MMFFPEFITLPNKLDLEIRGTLFKTNVHEFDDHYDVEMELPGFSQEEITLNFQDHCIKVKAEHKNSDEIKKDGKVIKKERFYSSGYREIFIGDDVDSDNIKAKLENGVLLITLKKQPKEIKKSQAIKIE